MLVTFTNSQENKELARLESPYAPDAGDEVLLNYRVHSVVKRKFTVNGTSLSVEVVLSEPLE